MTLHFVHVLCCFSSLFCFSVFCQLPLHIYVWHIWVRAASHKVEHRTPKHARVSLLGTFFRNKKCIFFSIFIETLLVQNLHSKLQPHVCMCLFNKWPIHWTFLKKLWVTVHHSEHVPQEDFPIGHKGLSYLQHKNKTEMQLRQLHARLMEFTL